MRACGTPQMEHISLAFVTCYNRVWCRKAAGFLNHNEPLARMASRIPQPSQGLRIKDTPNILILDTDNVNTMFGGYATEMAFSVCMLCC